MKQGGRKMIYSDKELEIMKTTFADNEALLMVIRKSLLQMELSDADKKILSGSIKTQEAKDVLRHVLKPTLDSEAPFLQLLDMWTIINTKETRIEDMKEVAEGHKLFIDLLEQGLQIIEGTLEKPEITLDSLVDIEGKTAQEIYVNITARNLFISMADKQLNNIKILAGHKEDSVEETLARLQQDSTK